MQDFFAKAVRQDHPRRALERFLDQEQRNEMAKRYEDLRFVGYVLEIGYDTVTVITSDAFKTAVGGVPRNSLLIMVPADMRRVAALLHAAPRPGIGADPAQQGRPADVFRAPDEVHAGARRVHPGQAAMGALQTGVLGMFYPHPSDIDAIEFSGDLNNFVSVHKSMLQRTSFSP